jgi:GTPase SAR1 family protein
LWLVFGDRRVGKKNLISRMFSLPFSADYEPLAGAIVRRGFRCMRQEKVIAEAMIFSELDSLQSCPRSSRRPLSLIFVYDLTNPESFGCIQKWMKAVSDVYGTAAIASIPTFVVGNKKDLIPEAS